MLVLHYLHVHHTKNYNFAVKLVIPVSDVFATRRRRKNDYKSDLRPSVCALFRPAVRPRELVSVTPTSFIGFTLYLVDFLPMIWRCADGSRILIRLF